MNNFTGRANLSSDGRWAELGVTVFKRHRKVMNNWPPSMLSSKVGGR